MKKSSQQQIDFCSRRWVLATHLCGVTAASVSVSRAERDFLYAQMKFRQPRVFTHFFTPGSGWGLRNTVRKAFFFLDVLLASVGEIWFEFSHLIFQISGSS